MFEISFGELLLIGVVALIVLGPERLPTVARTIGALVGRAQRFVASVKSDIHQQSQMAGLQELKQDVQDAANAFRDQVQREVDDTRQVAQDIAYSVAPVSAAVQASASELAQIAHEASQPSESIAPEDMLAAAGVVPEQKPTEDEGQLDLFAPPATTSASDQSVAEPRS
ncbi:Sec-independent protein translocase protein TatB [Vogesella mureinivorans]|uniref:Sec-independent protein translocase protein TatB n=1 Tax=Vogesella mureinivorans TaxID=657276 RepID=UPI0011CAA111|nr:Sec-independent protein translocase protein TatB [Vogesella mureinivorans]